MLQTFFQNSTQQVLTKYSAQLQKINSIGNLFSTFSDKQLQEKTLELKKKLEDEQRRKEQDEKVQASTNARNTTVASSLVDSATNLVGNDSKGQGKGLSAQQLAKLREERLTKDAKMDEQISSHLSTIEALVKSLSNDATEHRNQIHIYHLLENKILESTKRSQQKCQECLFL